MHNLAAKALLAAAALLLVSAARAEAPVTDQVQSALESWLERRAPVEKVTGIAAYVSFGDPGPAIEAFAGKIGRDPQDPPVRPETLFPWAAPRSPSPRRSSSAGGRRPPVSIDDTVGQWLPEYPAWKDVNIRRLLDMSSGIPNYSETAGDLADLVEEPQPTPHRRGAGRRSPIRRRP